MLCYEKLHRRPALLRQLTGLPFAAFNALALRFSVCWQEAEVHRLTRSTRCKALGAGRPYALHSDRDKLLMFLLICRQGLTYDLAGVLFGFDPSNARKLYLRLVPVVQKAADPDLACSLRRDCLQRAKMGGTLKSWHQFLGLHPHLQQVAIDTTSQRRTRPVKKAARRKSYSGKHKAHLLKTLTLVDKTGRIRYVSPSCPGATSDTAMYQACGLGEWLPPNTQQYLDLGFQGIVKEYPACDIRLPYKRHSPGRKGRGTKGPPLTRGQKQANTLRRKKRVGVEHGYARIKGFRILTHLWRSREQRYNPTFQAVAAVSNFRHQHRLDQATAQGLKAA